MFQLITFFEIPFYESHESDSNFCHTLYIFAKSNFCHTLYVFDKSNFCHTLYVFDKSNFCHTLYVFDKSNLQKIGLKQVLICFFFNHSSLLRTFMVHRTLVKGIGYFLNSSLSVPIASQRLRHYPGDYCSEHTSAHN